MKIGIDCRMLGSGFGLGRYTQQLVNHLLEIDKKNQYILFFRNANFKELGNIENSNVKIVIADIPWYSWQEQIKFKKIIKKAQVDLMHFPHWNIPLLYNDPFVVTVHDLIMYHYPRPEATTLGPIKFWCKDKLHRLVLKRVVKKAKHIIVTSEFTKQDIYQTLKVSENKMTVIYQAPFESQKSKVESQKSKIDSKYILYVGAAYPHKNLEGLLKAWEIFEREYSDQYQLVLAGKSDYFYGKIKKNKLINQLTNKPVFIDFVPDDELVELYSNASLYVFPSKYEGFGLPPLEAQSFGVPVASSNASCLPEVLGESALYFDPDSPEQMAKVIYQGLTDQNVRLELKQNARENLQRFSWNKLAHETLGIYKTVAK